MATIAYGIEVLENARLQNLILMEQMDLGTLSPFEVRQKAHYTKLLVEHELKDVYDSYTDAKYDTQLANLKELVYAQWKELDKVVDARIKDKNSYSKENSFEQEL